ncbi:MAG: hypothetical protein H6739_15770 [Alphaproteobacteria bacterium]|nr:hypothetical protein [Alphaproteobacteria bacterium]
MPDAPVSLPLTDAEYWDAPSDEPVRLMRALGQQGAEGVFLGLPARVPLEERQTLPLLTVCHGPAQTPIAWRLAQRGVVVVVDPEARLVLAGRVSPSPPPGPPGASPRTGTTMTRERIDLRAHLGLPWRPSRLRVCVLQRDQRTPWVETELVPSGRRFQDPEIARHLALLKARMVPREVDPLPGDPLPRYTADEDALAVPDTPGLALSADRVVVLEPGARCVLRGAFRVAARPQELLPVGEAGQPTAIVGVTLVVIGADTPEPVTLRLRVPCFDAVDPEDPEVTGHFAMDLLAYPGLRKTPQTRFVYGFCGEHVGGPAAYALVPLAWLPTEVAE